MIGGRRVLHLRKAAQRWGPFQIFVVCWNFDDGAHGCRNKMICFFLITFSPQKTSASFSAFFFQVKSPEPGTPRGSLYCLRPLSLPDSLQCPSTPPAALSGSYFFLTSCIKISCFGLKCDLHSKLEPSALNRHFQCFLFLIPGSRISPHLDFRCFRWCREPVFFSSTFGTEVPLCGWKGPSKGFP